MTPAPKNLPSSSIFGADSAFKSVTHDHCKFVEGETSRNLDMVIKGHLLQKP